MPSSSPRRWIVVLLLVLCVPGVAYADALDAIGVIVEWVAILLGAVALLFLIFAGLARASGSRLGGVLLACLGVSPLLLVGAVAAQDDSGWACISFAVASGIVGFFAMPVKQKADPD